MKHFTHSPVAGKPFVSILGGFIPVFTIPGTTTASFSQSGLFPHLPLSLPVSLNVDSGPYCSPPPPPPPFLLCAISGEILPFTLQAAATATFFSRIFYCVSYKKKKQAVTFRFHIPAMCCCHREQFNSWKSPGFCILAGARGRPRSVGAKYRQSGG